jgi:hypothetical protein
MATAKRNPRETEVAVRLSPLCRVIRVCATV